MRTNTGTADLTTEQIDQVIEDRLAEAEKIMIKEGSLPPLFVFDTTRGPGAFQVKVENGFITSHDGNLMRFNTLGLWPRYVGLIHECWMGSANSQLRPSENPNSIEAVSLRLATPWYERAAMRQILRDRSGNVTGFGELMPCTARASLNVYPERLPTPGEQAEARAVFAKTLGVSETDLPPARTPPAKAA